MMRGYYLGRYRDENLLALQSEIRLRFHPASELLVLLVQEQSSHVEILV